MTRLHLGWFVVLLVFFSEKKKKHSRASILLWMKASTACITAKSKDKEGIKKAKWNMGSFPLQRGCWFVPCPRAARCWQPGCGTQGRWQEARGGCLPCGVKGPPLLPAGRGSCVSHRVAAYHRAADNLKCWKKKSTPCQVPSASLAWRPNAP